MRGHRSHRSLYSISSPELTARGQPNRVANGDTQWSVHGRLNQLLVAPPHRLVVYPVRGRLVVLRLRDVLAVLLGLGERRRDGRGKRGERQAAAPSAGFTIDQLVWTPGSEFV